VLFPVTPAWRRGRPAVKVAGGAAPRVARHGSCREAGSLTGAHRAVAAALLEERTDIVHKTNDAHQRTRRRSLQLRGVEDLRAHFNLNLETKR